MLSNNSRGDLKLALLRAALIVLLLASASFAQQQVNLTAGSTSITLPDGTFVPMWGYSCGAQVSGSAAICDKLNPGAAGWSPVLITVPTTAAGGLTINLTNSLPVPTSITVVGQLGGGLGTAATSTPSPIHGAQSATWPISDPGTTNTPPSQGNRVQSFSTEVGLGATTLLPAWANLRPGTYLIESGTHPSIQGPMGLFGMLVVTDATTGTPYPNVHYDADVRVLFSEIDPVQNTAVNTAVNTPGFSETRVWSGQPGGCGNPNSGPGVYNTCYPPAVNYSPRYYLVNGVAFDKTHAAASLFAATPGSGVAGNVLVRMVNAGLRMHVPSIVGSQSGASAASGFSLIAEDGNPLPGIPRVQSEVFMAAGKTYDVMVNVPTAGSSALPIYDRALGLSGNATTRDAGMLAYISINGATLPNVTAFTATSTAMNDAYNSVIADHTFTVSDPAKGVIANDVNVYNVKVSTAPTKGNLTLNSDGTFTYVPNAGWTSPDSFVYQANGSGPTATVTLNACTTGNGCLEGAGGITVNNDAYSSTIATTVTIKQPGVLANDKDAAGYPLTAEFVASAGVTVSLNPDGSFTATVPAHPGTTVTPTFTYRARNSQGTLSAGTATVNLTFPAPSGLQVTLVDGKSKQALSPQDYRWIIEEDRTFYINPSTTTNNGNAVVPTFGTNFHTSYMPVVAQGCTGDISCESGQTVFDPATGNHVSAVCDIGNGACRPGLARTAVQPSQVVLDPTKRYYISVLPGDGQGDPISHAMGGAQIAAGQTNVTVIVEPTPLPTAKVSVFVFEDDFPTNGEHDSGGGIDVLGTNEPALGGFNITLFDDVGGTGDAAGQMTYDMFNQPLGNALAGTIDPATRQDACPVSADSRTGFDGVQSPTGLTGVIPVCPKFEADGVTLSPLAGQAVIANLPPGRYGVVATPGADRIAKGEEWLQTNTLDGGKAHDSFIKVNEPGYFQEYGPAGYHVAIGFANPAIINARKTGDFCTSAGGCTHNVTGKVTGVHMSRTPDERLYSSGTRDTFGYTQCYASLGSPKGADFAFAKCDDQGVFTLTGIPAGDWRVTIFDQWNDQIVDGISTPVRVTAASQDMGEVAVHAWKANLYTRSFLDSGGGVPSNAGDGVSNVDGDGNPTEPGLTLASTNIRFRDGSFSNFNNTDLAGFAGFNEIFPLFNWYVVETTSTRYKNTGTHVVYDAGGPVDGSASCGAAGYPPCGSGSTGISTNYANTNEAVPLPANLRVPGAVYCNNADCSGFSIKNGPGTSQTGSTGRIDPPWVTAEAWQGFIGQNSFIEFGKRPFAEGENGGINGHVVYASTRPFDDPALLLQLSWEPLVPHVTINLYQVGTAADGSQSLTMVDHTQSSSWDDWAQGFRSDGIPNMNCPGQRRGLDVDPTNGDLFFFTLNNQPFYLNPNTPLPLNSQFKCFDGLHNFNQVQPAPYDGMYQFPSIIGRNSSTGVPEGAGSTNGVPGSRPGTNCTICGQDSDGSPMLPAGKYVVEMIVPPGYELVKEEDKNILLGDLYVAPVTSQFAGFGNIFIIPDQAAVGATYNPNNPLIPTTNFGEPRHEGDTGSVETFWPCVGTARIVPDFMSIFPGSGQNSPFAGATRNLCDRKEVTLEDQMSALAKFYVFTSTHVAAHFTGLITDDFTAEFDPFSPTFGEKFSPPNLPVSVKDWAGNEVSRVYGDQWGAYNGLNYSSYGVNPPDPSGFVPTMMVFCMNDIGNAAHPDALFQPQYSQFCYETPFMPGQTQYMDTPVVPTSAFAGAGYNNPDCAYPDATPAIGSVNGPGGSGPYVSGAGQTLTITALGDQTVNNYGYSGPSAKASPFNQKTITRHYGFGSTAGTVALVGSDGVARSLTGVSWSDTTISGAVPNNVPLCTTQQQAQYGGSQARCGELVITAANGKKSVDTVTVTIGGKAPTVLTAGQTIQSAIDAARPGDLIIVPAGVYKELVTMWKPVRLQGVGAASSIIDANTHPSGVVDPWRAKMVCLFGLSLNGQPQKRPSGTDPGNPFDPSGTFECGTTGGVAWSDFHGGDNNPQVDRMPLEGILGWDAQVNGNLAEQLQEPTLLGAYEGAGITVVGKGVRYPAGASFIFGNGPDNGSVATASQFPLGTNLLTNSAGDCNTAVGATGYSSNFLCNPSRIDGLSVTNSSQGGGGILAHGWAHNLEISNNRVYNNTGTLSGGISIGIGETPDALLSGNNGDPVGFDQQPWTCVTGAVVGGVQQVSPPGRADGQELPFCYDRNVSVHHNAITTNSSIGDELFSATPAGAGGITFCPGSDGYKLTQNWVCGNLSTSDGGGVVHLGYSENGLIDHNSILFNQSTNPTTVSSGGGIMVMTTAPDGLAANGTECGSITDVDCAPSLGDGVGPGLVINANLIQGNAAESGSGGGIRLQGVNGTEISRFPLQPNQWYEVNVTNNIITNNVAGWDGAGVSLQDSLKVNLINNSIVSNDSTAASGVLFTTFRAGEASAPPPDGSQCSGPNCSLSNPQVAGVAADGNSASLIASFATVPLGAILCPAGHSSGLTNPLIPLPVPNGDCKKASFPILYNNLIWKNRAFHISVGATNAQYQQNVVSLVPTLNQPGTAATTANGSGQIVTGGTGACVTPPSGTYWDIGVRGDTGPNNHASTVTLQPVSSVLSSGTYNGSNHNSGTDPTVVKQYCNGSRIPPEFGGTGYQVPPGTNEGNVPVPLFALTAAATVDEGNNWINIGWGPLSMTHPAITGVGAGQLLGNYALATGSPSINYITVLNSTVSYNAAPGLDFFNNPRKVAGNTAVDVGAVEGAGGAVGGGDLTVSPTAVPFGNVAVNNNSAGQTLTLVNNTGASVSGISVAVTTTSPAPAPNVFSRPAGAAGGNCGTTVTSLANGANCTIVVVFRPVAANAYAGLVTISASAGVVGSPVNLAGTGIAPVKPALGVPLDNFNRANANTLGGNWLQFTAGAAGAAITVNSNQASDPLLAGTAFWNPTAFTAKEAAAFTIANVTVNNDALILAATGAPVLSVYPNFIRVQYTTAAGGTITVATTTNGGLGFTTAGTLTGTAFLNGDIITALLDGTNAVAAPTVYVWRTRAGVDTFVGAVQIPPNATWQGGGRIGISLPGGARVDDFAGGTAP